MTDPHRDAAGLAFAWVDNDMGRAALVLAGYRFDEEALHLLAAVLSLVLLDRPDGFRDRLEWLALAGAGRRPVAGGHGV